MFGGAANDAFAWHSRYVRISRLEIVTRVTGFFLSYGGHTLVTDFASFAVKYRPAVRTVYVPLLASAMDVSLDIDGSVAIGTRGENE
jgi:hypothetical protein